MPGKRFSPYSSVLPLLRQLCLATLKRCPYSSGQHPGQEPGQGTEEKRLPHRLYKATAAIVKQLHYRGLPLNQIQCLLVNLAFDNNLQWNCKIIFIFAFSIWPKKKANRGVSIMITRKVVKNKLSSKTVSKPKLKTESNAILLTEFSAWLWLIMIQKMIPMF